MTRLPRPRFLAFAGLATAALALAVTAATSGARQGSGLVRGNKPGEWRYWGGDAWSTRYSPLDQINEGNFKKIGRAHV